MSVVIEQGIGSKWVFKTFFEIMRRDGVSKLIKESFFQATTRYYENHFGVSTRGSVPEEELGYLDAESCHYSSVHYRHMLQVFRKLPVKPEESVLLDYGCGKGRVIVTASSFPFKRVIGVEISNLINIAHINVSRMKHRKAREIVLEKCPAQNFVVPSDVNIFYFFNPFRGSILEKVTQNIRASYQQTPRKIFIVFFNNDHFDRIIFAQPWLSKIEQSQFHPDISFGLYETPDPPKQFL
ncbi:MAG: class I SAM-dependent methyltransferase [Terriglobia bacterium]